MLSFMSGGKRRPNSVCTIPTERERQIYRYCEDAILPNGRRVEFRYVPLNGMHAPWCSGATQAERVLYNISRATLAAMQQMMAVPVATQTKSRNWYLFIVGPSVFGLLLN